MAASIAQFAGFFAVIGAVACVTDHDALARRDPPGGTGGGARGGASGASAGRDGGREAGPGDAAGGTAGTDAEKDAPTEPRGPSRLTLFHGVVDAPRIAFCAVRVGDGASAQALEPIFPEAGLAYATPFVPSTLTGLDLG